MKKKVLLTTAGMTLTAALLWLTVLLVQKDAPFFYDMLNYRFSAHHLTFDVANVNAQLAQFFKYIISLYGRSYILPVFLCLLPAVFVCAYVLSKILPALASSLDWLNNSKKEKIFLCLAFILCFILITCSYFAVLEDFPLSSDEYSYIFQGEILASGRLYAPSPPLPQSFKSANILSGEKWFSKYTIGLPLLLLPGIMLNVPFVINALFASLSLLLIYFITKELFGKKPAFLSVFLSLLSPVYLLMAGTYFPHTAAGFFILFLIYYILKIQEESPLYYSLAASFSMIMLLLIRPADGGIIFLSLIPLMIYRWINSPKKIC